MGSSHFLKCSCLCLNTSEFNAFFFQIFFSVLSKADLEDMNSARCSSGSFYLKYIISFFKQECIFHPNVNESIINRQTDPLKLGVKKKGSFHCMSLHICSSSYLYPSRARRSTLMLQQQILNPSQCNACSSYHRCFWEMMFVEWQNAGFKGIGTTAVKHHLSEVYTYITGKYRLQHFYVDAIKELLCQFLCTYQEENSPSWSESFPDTNLSWDGFIWRQFNLVVQIYSSTFICVKAMD